MARFIFFLGIFLMIYQSSNAKSKFYLNFHAAKNQIILEVFNNYFPDLPCEKSNIFVNGKHGARNLIGIPRPTDASKFFDIISCTAKKSENTGEKTLSEVNESGRTSGHFISIKHNCSYEIITTLDYGKWYITTQYYAQDNITINTQRDIITLIPPFVSIRI